MLRSTLIAIAGAAFAASGALANSVSVESGTPYVTDGIFDFAVTGDEMAGMEVTATFASGASETAVWAATGVNAGGAAGTGWSLSLDGDTFLNTWELANTSNDGIVGLLIDGVPGDTVFDRIFEPFNTTGSRRGIDFEVMAGPDITVDAVYRNEVSVAGEAFAGDVYTELEVSFDGPFEGEGLLYMADTDLAEVTAIPLPAAVWTGLGMLGALGVARRLRK